MGVAKKTNKEGTTFNIVLYTPIITYKIITLKFLADSGFLSAKDGILPFYSSFQDLLRFSSAKCYILHCPLRFESNLCVVS